MLQLRPNIEARFECADNLGIFAIRSASELSTLVIGLITPLDVITIFKGSSLDIPADWGH